VSTIVRGSNYNELPVPVQRKLDELASVHQKLDELAPVHQKLDEFVPVQRKLDERPVQRKLDEFLSPVQRKLDEDCVLVQSEDKGRCKSEPDSTSTRVIDNISNSTSTTDSVGGRQTSSSLVQESSEAVPPAQFVASNIFQLEVEPKFEVELPCSTYANPVL